MIEVDAITISTSTADDLAYRALADVCDITRLHNVRVVGGQMVNLLLTAFPARQAVPRRTADADAAIDTELASSGVAHHLLIQAGYEAQSGNSYTRQERQIDLLVPSRTGRFQTEQLGGRGFDAAPGLSLALASEPIVIRASVELRDGEVLTFAARVPTVEIATVIKASSFRSRRADRDLVDLHNLLWIVENLEPDSIGGWTLNKPQRAARRDAQRALTDIATSLSARSTRPQLEINTEALVALIRRHVVART
ncbi:MAG: hypothetical protein RJQ01_06710 [Microcella sp.]|uniref:hypothetical protein n=1 Tax=Microcella sp. TaxID=1913979 RepID=UPI00331590F1